MVVLHDKRFSHPYVDWDARLSANNRMPEHLAKNEIASFKDLAKEYPVNYVLVKEYIAEKLRQAQSPCLQPMFFNKTMNLYRIRCLETL